MDKAKKSQAAVEFIILVAFMLFAITSFFAITSSKVLEAREEGNKNIAKSIADYAYREIDTARTVNDGYSRKFTMPSSIDGNDYTIAIVDNRELVVTYLENEFIKFLPSDVTGSIAKGLNKISKNQGIISVQPST